MGRPQTLTREWLEQHHVVDVSKDGIVTMKSKRGELYTVNPVTTVRKSRYGEKRYHLIGIYSTEERERQKVAYKESGTWACGVRFFALSRIIWAWHHGECPANMDIDHINNDSLDDRLENYQLLTRAENLAKRRGHMNQ